MLAANHDRFVRHRHIMVETQVLSRGISTPSVVEAMRKVPRHLFTDGEHSHEAAYEDSALPIGEGQTMSQPYIVGRMIDLLRSQFGGKALEVGLGSGYAAAVLSQMMVQVYAVDRHRSLVDKARDKLKALGYVNIEVRHSDGVLGWPESSPYNAITVAAAAPQIPQALLEQLGIGGQLVMPVGLPHKTQRLVRVTRTPSGDFRHEYYDEVRFVPLVHGDEPHAPKATS